MTDAVAPVDLGSSRRVHLVAIGGAGMSAIATVLVGRGHRVTGSDAVASATTARLVGLGVDVSIGHAADHVGDAELLVVSSAVADDNAEVVAARQRGVPVLGRRALLDALAATTPLVSISGTHGKTTTTSMTAVALRGAGLDPSFIIGAEVPALGCAAHAGADPVLVLEADESDASFLAAPRRAALVTNVEADHLEFWGGWEQLLDGFDRFLAGTDGPRVVCADDATARALGDRHGAVSYGCSPDATYRIVDLRCDPTGSSFTLSGPTDSVDVGLAMPGEHNALDAAGAVVLCAELGHDVRAAAAGLAGFRGAARRFDRRGSRGGVDLVDDYAHLPTEVRAVLSAGRAGGWERVVAVFQPHRYSRTEALWSDFADAFDDADVLVLTGIYPAGEAPRPGVSAELLRDAIRARTPGLELRWCPTLDEVADELVGLLRPGDLCLTIGAGDVTRVPDLVLDRLDPTVAP